MRLISPIRRRSRSSGKRRISRAIGEWNIARLQALHGNPRKRPRLAASPSSPSPLTVSIARRISGLQPGGGFDYRVLLAGKEVFRATGRARKSFAQPYRFALFGDCGEDSPGQRGVAYQVSLLHPDFVFIPGDIVYKRGRVSEYCVKFFPIYNSDTASPTAGAPLLRSVLFLSVAGNHDSQHRDLDESPDGMAYFLNWLQPLNGPDAAIFHSLEGAQANRKAFLAAAGKQFPQMANFSFDYGNSHWTVLDSNPYVNWNDPALRQWIANDLSSAAHAQWRFVAFHHPGFHSANKHAEQQQMRVLSPVFEAGKVDVVFSGHVHNYERSYPLRFVPQPVDLGQKKLVPGVWRLDRNFDGASKTKADGVIYIVDGAGGAHLYDPELQEQPNAWKEFTTRYIARVNSFSDVQIDGNRFTLRQISSDGRLLDTFRITK